MDNPIVTVDLTNHRYYSQHRHTHFMARIWKAEILMLNTNRETMRVRLLDENDEVVVKNVDLDVSYIVEDVVEVRVR